MKIHKEGYASIIIVGFLLVVAGVLLNFKFPIQSIYHYIYYGFGFVFFFFIVRFFRVPKRIFIEDDNAIICAADGKVVAIEEIFDTEYFNDKRIQVSVFMSPFNVHVNWYPISGFIKKTVHKVGKHMPAFLPKASMLNEQSGIVIQHINKEEILVRQIAGTLARRIVFYSKEDQEAIQGEQLGIIKFGSRVDFLLPINVKINVALEQKVKAGLDVIAYFK
jgi:phosphatidylserine decarboxylase